MEKLYRKNELAFSLLWIAFYVVLFSLADAISENIGVIKIVTLPVTLALVFYMVYFIRNNRLEEYYGVSRLHGIEWGRYLYFIPLAVLVSSNLLNGAELLPTILQIVYATAIGYLFTVLFIRTKNLIPCIAAHGTINALSIFSVEGGPVNQVGGAAVLTFVSLGYAIYLNRKIPPAAQSSTAG